MYIKNVKKFRHVIIFIDYDHPEKCEYCKETIAENFIYVNCWKMICKSNMFNFNMSGDDFVDSIECMHGLFCHAKCQ